MNKEYFESFFISYLECALWSSTQPDEKDQDMPLDDLADTDDFAEDTLKEMREEALDFFRSAYRYLGENTLEQGGHDFWLTRNRHGAGFWDGGYPKHGSKLTEMAKIYGTVDLYYDYETEKVILL